MTEEQLSIRDTARGVAIRAGLLTAGGILIGGWIVGVALKIAGRAIHFLLLAGLALVAGGFVTYEAKRRFGSDEEQPAGPRALPSYQA